MDKKIKQKWIKALNSGEYVQGTGALKAKGKESDKFCCLGVLCDIYAKEKGAPWDLPGQRGRYHLFGNDEFLPDPVRIWARLDSGDPQVVYDVGDEDKETDTLSRLNDDAELGFKEIATLIEAQF